MPSFVPRGMEPYRKRELLDKRLRSLQGAIKFGASAPRVADAAEKVRSAVFAVIKAQRSIMEYRLESDARARQLDNLREDEQRWRSLSAARTAASSISTPRPGPSGTGR